MPILLVVLVLGLLFGVGGLITAAKWLFIFALAFWIVGAVKYRGR